MEENRKIDLLIVRKLTGSVTQEESKELERFISESVANRKYVETYEKLWHESNSSLFHKIDPQKDWQKVRQRMGFDTKERRIISKRKSFSRIAAVLVPAFILISVLGFYYFVPGFGRLTAYKAEKKEQIQLPDGSDITLKKGSTLLVVRDLKGKNRKVKLAGEAYFEVAKDRKHPFVVAIAGVDVEVLGTAFNLENNGKEVRIHVTRGVVRFSHKQDEILVHKGEEAVFDGKRVYKTDIRDENFMSWKTGVMNFNNADVKDIFSVIVNTYDEVKGYKVNSKTKTKVTTRFDNQPLSAVLDELQIHFNKKIVLHDGILVISD